MSWSGFILYIAPPGRIANWGSWKLMLFTKTEWQALHTIFSYLFFILVVIHLFFINWRTFLNYFKSKLKAGLNRKWELISAVILSTIIFAGTLRSWTPFGPVMTFGEKVKEGWGNKFETPPVVHMENYTLEQLSPLFDSIPAEELARTLIQKNIRIKESDTTLKLIGEENHITPSKIYETLVEVYGTNSNETHSAGRQGNSTGQGGSGQGFGRTTLKMAADNLGLEVSGLINILKEKGIEAAPETTIRDIADKLGISPREAYDMLSEK